MAIVGHIVNLSYVNYASYIPMNKGSKFLKKLWWNGGSKKKDNLVLSFELIVLIGHRKEFKAEICQSLGRRANTRNVSYETLYGGQFTTNSVDKTKFPSHTHNLLRAIFW